MCNKKACDRCYTVSSFLAGDESETLDGDRRALRSPVPVVKVVEVSAAALVEDVGATKSQATVSADRPTRGVDGTSLGWLVELELVVGGDVSCASLRVGQNTILQRDLEGGVGLASDELSSWGCG